ncbi:unnamed protein product, partial [Ectocarpus sp. 13 AM-2016]
PKKHAEDNGVIPSLSFELTLAPSCKRVSMAAHEPNIAAQWSGVRPVTHQPSISAPAPNSTRMVAALFSHAAIRSRFPELGSAPSVKSTFTVAMWFSFTARRRGVSRLL